MKILDIGFCPRCKEDLEGMMTRNFKGVKFCYLCSFDLEETPSERHWVKWAKDYAKNADIKPKEEAS